MGADQTKPNQPPKTKPKGTVLTQLKIRQSEQEALKRVRPGAAVPTVPKKAPPPRALTPAELKPSAPPPAAPQAPPPPPNLPPPGPPLGPEQTAEGNILEIVAARILRSRLDTPPSADTGMSLVQSISHQIQTGQPLKLLEAETEKFLGEFTAKSHIWKTALAYHDIFERGALYVQARWILEKSLWEDLVNNRLSPAEKLALLQLCIKESDKIKEGASKTQDDMESAGKGTTGDISSTTERADRTLDKTTDPTVKHLDGTSPVGRELARRLLDTAGKNAEKIVADAIKTPAPA